MKRKILCLLLAVALIVAMALPAFAAEIDLYDYEVGPCVLTLNESFEQIGSVNLNEYSFFTHELFPSLSDGYYFVELNVLSVDVLYSSLSDRPVLISSEQLCTDGTHLLATRDYWRDLIYFGDGLYAICEAAKGEDRFVTFFAGNSDGSSSLSSLQSIKFYKAIPPATDSLSSVITADTVGGVFTELVALLPVSIGAVVIFIGIRKAIHFLQSFVHGA